MARRAAYTEQYRQRRLPMLSLAGAYEFLADDPFQYGRHAKNIPAGHLPPQADARKALAAYNLLHVDAGWLSQRSAKWLQQSVGALPAGFAEVKAEPVVRMLPSDVGTIAVVLFPEGPVEGKGPTPELEEKVLAAGRALQGKAALIIGLSPWGYVGEHKFLPKAAGIYSCILGSGEGIGFGFSIKETQGRVLWARPDSQGRAVNTIELLEKPAPGKTFLWKEEDTFRAMLEFLDDDCPASPEMQRIIGE